MVRRFHSQFGEDRLLSEIFSDVAHGSCVEVGANDGVNDSNSLYFETIGWKCVLVEPNPHLCLDIRRTRSALLFECAASKSEGSATLNIAVGASRSHGVSSLAQVLDSAERIRSFGFDVEPLEVRTRRLDSILEDSGLRPGFEFMTIDVEGHELMVLQGFSLAAWKPQLLILESNAGPLNARMDLILRQAGYLFYMATGVNVWYRHESFILRRNLGMAILANHVRIQSGRVARKIYRTFLGKPTK